MHDKSTVTVKLALTCVACDIPASRKVCGFLGHKASLGCNKCYKKFNVQFGKPTDYSGFDREIGQLDLLENIVDMSIKLLIKSLKQKLKQQSQSMV